MESYWTRGTSTNANNPAFDIICVVADAHTIRSQLAHTGTHTERHAHIDEHTRLQQPLQQQHSAFALQCTESNHFYIIASFSSKTFISCVSIETILLALAFGFHFIYNRISDFSTKNIFFCLFGTTKRETEKNPTEKRKIYWIGRQSKCYNTKLNMFTNGYGHPL